MNVILLTAGAFIDDSIQGDTKTLGDALERLAEKFSGVHWSDTLSHVFPFWSSGYRPYVLLFEAIIGFASVLFVLRIIKRILQ